MKTANGRGYFLVDPVLRTGHYDTKLPLDSIACQTVLSKLLGPLPQWDDRLRVSRESGYNMIHFTPLQVLNKSTRILADDTLHGEYILLLSSRSI